MTPTEEQIRRGLNYIRKQYPLFYFVAGRSGLYRFPDGTLTEGDAVKVRVEYPPPQPPPKILIELEVNQARVLRDYLATLSERDPTWLLRELRSQLAALLRTLDESSNKLEKDGY